MIKNIHLLYYTCDIECTFKNKFKSTLSIKNTYLYLKNY